MFTNKRYIVVTNSESSIIHCADQSLHFSFRDVNERPTIKFEGQIGDFIQYETQLSEHLKKLNYKNRPWIKNELYFSIPNNASVVQMRCFFDAADQLDATRSYLLKENIALLYSNILSKYQNATTCFIGIYNSKLEISILEKLKFKLIKTYLADNELMASLEKKLESIILKNIDLASEKFKIDKYFVLTNVTNLRSILRNQSIDFEIIKNHQDLIIDGLQAASTCRASDLYDRQKM